MSFAFFKGMAIGASLIIAIGAQNMHVLRMGLLRQHLLLTALVCAGCDMLLITLGISGLGLLITAHENLLLALRYAGAAFLFFYGYRALRRALQASQMTVSVSPKLYSAQSALATALAVSLLNPHVFLDTVLLIGAIGAQETGWNRVAFGGGAALASWLWFFALAYGAKFLIPLFAQPRAWRILDAVIAIVVFSLGLGLIL